VSVRIYKLQREFDWWLWLCDTALARWAAMGWIAREEKDPPHPLPCVDRDEYNCCQKIEGEP
jgi:hypothetical protein